MRFEGFIDYWAHRIARHAANSADAAATSVRCSEALDAEIGYRDTPERTEIIERLRAETARIRSAEKTERPVASYAADAVQYAEGRYGNAFIKFNTEGEKQMEKIDWKKPLRALRPGPGGEVQKVYTYKSGRRRVVWIDDRVYPVDEQGRAVAEVRYSETTGALKGSRLVENVPAEEKFFLGLARNSDGTYWLTDGGMPTTISVMNEWKTLVTDQPHWIVDTRKSAEPPKEVVHDPKDFVVVYYGHYDETAACTGRLLTLSEAKKLCGGQDTIVRVRTTPVDTSRYVQLFRQKGSNGPWKINSAETQEGSWKEIQGWKAGCGIMEFVDIKVSD